MLTAEVTIRFGGPPGDFDAPDETSAYIAQPYWPEMYQLINITKESGMSRARTEKSRADALEQHLRRIGMTHEGYLALQAKANTPFHLNSDGKIIIPATSIMASMVCAADSAKGGNRIGGKDQIRTMIRTTPFSTDKALTDAKAWERFAVVTLGSGAKASNQRGFRTSQYVENFEAFGRVRFHESFVKPEAMHNFLKYAGTIGIGASRKLGWGRFAVTRFEVE